MLLLRSILLVLGLGACAASEPGAPHAPRGAPPAAADPDPAAAPEAGSDGLPAPPEQAPLRTATSESGTYTVAWRPLGVSVPENEPFELEFLLTHDGRPVPGARVAVRGWMPDHGHGMLRSPAVEERGEGWYRVRGMLLHMSGFWELFFDVYPPGERKDRVRFEVRL